MNADLVNFFIEKAENFLREENLKLAYENYNKALLISPTLELEEKLAVIVSNISFSNLAFLKIEKYSAGNKTHIVPEFIHTILNIPFVLIPGGKYTSIDKNGKLLEYTMEPFFISKVTITQGIWERLMGKNCSFDDDFVKRHPEHPAVNISWKEAIKLCQKFHLDLPNIIQWEYAYKAGTTSKYYWGNQMDKQYVWFEDCFGVDSENRHAQPVGLKKPNAFGLLDMSGNVWEWTKNEAKDYNIDPVGAFYVCKGGSFLSSAEECSVSSYFIDNGIFYHVGFRVIIHCCF